DELRRQADQFVDLADLAPQLARDNGRRDAPPPVAERPYESNIA
ncbi:MAG: NYN domain-containing protein, partial [Alphaproteobacteria bacterium]|nr:NYN domain-containing protein [Alphaproteobacteria bacterium]